MRLTPLKVFAAAALLSAVSAVAVVSHAEGDATLAEIARYREWEALTPEPLRVESASPGGG